MGTFFLLLLVGVSLGVFLRSTIHPEDIAEYVVDEIYERHDPDRMAERIAYHVASEMERRERRELRKLELYSITGDPADLPD